MRRMLCTSSTRSRRGTASCSTSSATSSTRFGEIDKTAELLQHIASKTTGTVVLNREDPRVARIAQTLDGLEVLYFGLDDSLLSTFPNDDDMPPPRAARCRPPLPGTPPTSCCAAWAPTTPISSTTARRSPPR